MSFEKCILRVLLFITCLSPYKRMFEDRGQGMGLSASLRESLIFAPHDLVSHPPFPRLDLIVCHLPFSVFTSSQQSSILNRFAYALLPHGLLVLLSPGEISPDPLLYSRHDKSLFPTYSRTVAPVSLSTLGWGRTPAALSLVSSPPQRVPDEDTEAVLEEQFLASNALAPAWAANGSHFQLSAVSALRTIS